MATQGKHSLLGSYRKYLIFTQLLRYTLYRYTADLLQSNPRHWLIVGRPFILHSRN